MKKFIKKSKSRIKRPKIFDKIADRIKKSKKLKAIKRKAKEFVLHINDKEYLKENIKIVILGILSIIFLVAITIYIVLSVNISKIEEEKLINDTVNYSNYIEDITDSKSKEIDKYIIYALDYSKNVNNSNEMSPEAISHFLEVNLNKKIKAEDIENYGVNPNMLERNITFDTSKKSYVLNDKNLDRQSIGKNQVTYYKRVKIRKINRKKYTIKYEKYIIDDPYKVLDYFLEKNRSDKGVEGKDGVMTYDIVDTTGIKNYLMTGEISNIKSFLNQNNKDIKKFAKKSGTIKIVYVISDSNEVQIYKIKK